MLSSSDDEVADDGHAAPSPALGDQAPELPVGAEAEAGVRLRRSRQYGNEGGTWVGVPSFAGMFRGGVTAWPRNSTRSWLRGRGRSPAWRMTHPGEDPFVRAVCAVPDGHGRGSFPPRLSYSRVIIELMFEPFGPFGLPASWPSCPYPGAMTVSAHDVAAVLRERLPGLGQVKLHKLLYYCQGHHLATFNEPLFRETVSAWDLGPVVGTLWRQEDQGEPSPSRTDLDEAALNTIGYVLSRYGAASGTDLKHMTHAERPWLMADESRPAGGRVRIQEAWMRDYFRTEGAPDVGEDDIPLDSAAVSDMLRKAACRPLATRADSIEELRAWATRGA